MATQSTSRYDAASSSALQHLSGPRISPPNLPSHTIPAFQSDSLPARRAKTAAMLSTRAGLNDEAAVPTTGTQKGNSTKRPVRDSKRRATHSQIERRRREKINDRLVTLRVIVPACTAEVEERKRQKRQEEEEARKIAAGEMVPTSVKGKRRRNRRKASTSEAAEKEDELGLHKLDVLTHTIEYIYELQDRIEELEQGVKRSEPRKVVDAQEMEENRDGKAEHEDDDEDSEADLEMSDWKPNIRRKLSESTSSAVMSLSAESPMFSSATNSSASAFTNLTSPMMSLSSDSPILRWDNSKDTTESPPTKGSRSMQSLDLKRKKAHSNLSASHGIDWRLPAPALPFEDKPRLKHRHTCSGSNSHLTGFTNQVKSTSTSQDAHLLLSLSTSPESLRPISAMRDSFQWQRRTSLAPSMSAIISQSAGSKNKVAGSAPGGAHATSSDSLLISPPLLALDEPVSTSGTSANDNV